MKLFFYSPDPSNHELFDLKTTDWIGKTDNFISWIVRGYIFLKQAGFNCEIIDKIPEQGIVLADSDTLAANVKDRYVGKAMLICVKGDKEFRASAHLHVVQNINDLEHRDYSLWNPYHIKFWPQPALIPRSSSRGARVKNVAYMGTKTNSIPEFFSDDWINSLKALDCQWNPIVDKPRWNDYSEIDVTTAVRPLSFQGNPYHNKPSSKLTNSWHAGVPAILPPESAYMNLRKSELDFLVVNSLDELIAAIKKLKDNPQLYLAMVENGKNRAEDFAEEKIIQIWIKFLTQYVPAKYEEWLKMSDLERKYLYLRRYTKLKEYRMLARIRKWLGIESMFWDKSINASHLPPQKYQ